MVIPMVVTAIHTEVTTIHTEVTTIHTEVMDILRVTAIIITVIHTASTSLFSQKFASSFAVRFYSYCLRY